MPSIDVSLSRIGVQSSVERGPAALPELTVREATSFPSKSLDLTIYSRRDCAIHVFSMVSIMNYSNNVVTSTGSPIKIAQLT